MAPRIPAPYILASALACALASASASAPDAARDTAELPESRVRARAAAVPGLQVIGPEDLSRRQNLAEALRAVPGFRVRLQSGLGGYSEAAFRGTDGRQIAVYLDGVPLQSSLSPAVDLGKVPALMVREMAVDKGGLASADGPEAGAAAIRLTTLPRGSAPVSVTGRLSSFGGQEAAMAAKASASARGDAAIHLGAGAQGARNGFPYPSDNGTAFLASDDGWRAMGNNAYRGQWLGLGWSSAGRGRESSLGARWEAHRKEYPGIHARASSAFTDRAELSLHGRRRDTLEAGFLDSWSAAASARFAGDAFRDPDRSLGYATYSLERESRVLAAALGLSARLPGGGSLRLGSRGGYEASDSREEPGFREYTPPDARRFHAEPWASLSAPLGAALAFRAEAMLSRERLESENMAGVSGSRVPAPFARDAGAATWRALLAWRHEGAARGDAAPAALLEVERLRRLPALTELLGDNNGVHRNMGLLPQETWGAALEGSAGAGPWRIAAGPFWQVTRGPIRLAPMGGSNFLHYVNGADYRSLGFEARLDASRPRWRAGSALTAAWPENLEGSAAGRLPAYASRVEAYSDLSVSPLPSLWLDADLEFRSAYWTNDRNLPGSRRPPEAVLGAGLRWRKRRLEAALRADNLGDAHYRDFAYSPKSGRRYAFRLSMNP